MGARLVAVMVTLAGCDQIFELDPAIEVTSAACDLTKPFGTPQRIDELSIAQIDDRDARLTPDELAVYFVTDRNFMPGDHRIWSARRATIDSAFGAPTPLQFTTLDVDQRTPFISSDELTLYYSAGPPLEQDLFVATRGAKGGQFGVSMPITTLDSPMTDNHLYLNGDETYAMFSSRRMDSSEGDLFASRRPSKESGLSTPEPLPGLEAVGLSETAPVIIDDLHLIFGRFDPIEEKYDIRDARYNDTLHTFETKDLAGVNSSEDDLRPGCRLMVAGCI